MIFSFERNADRRDLHSFPTRRSSDLIVGFGEAARLAKLEMATDNERIRALRDRLWNSVDRKSTRLNSSHVSISYAVFCLKKKLNIICPMATHSRSAYDTSPPTPRAPP